MKVQTGAHTVIVVNRQAGFMRGRRYKKYMTRKPYLNGRLVCPGSPDELPRCLDEVLGPETKRIIVMGGDGTFHHVAKEIINRKLTKQVDLGLLPMGTGCDLARNLKIPSNPVKALRLLSKGRPRPLDVMKVILDGEVRYGVNSASIGLSALVARRANRKARKYPWTYISSALREIIGYKAARLKACINGKPWYSGPALLLVAANGRNFGRGITIAPGAESDNGLIYCVAITTQKLFHLIPMLPGLFSGGFIKSRHVRITQTGNLHASVHRTSRLVVEVDGETYLAKDFQVQMIPSALKVIC